MNRNDLKKILKNFLLEYIEDKNKSTDDDYDKVSLVYDPKVRNGKDWLKYGGNFPIMRNGKTFYVSRSVAVSLYTYCKDENDEWCILANQRGNNAQNAKGLWNVSAGYLDYNETAQWAAKRETFEETGVNVPIKNIKMVGINSGKLETNDDITYKNQNTNNNTRQDVSIRFTAVLNGTIKNYPLSAKNCEPGEVLDIQWIPLSKVKNYKWAYGQGEKILSQAKNSIKELNHKKINNTNILIKQLKHEISNNKKALFLLDKLLKEIHYNE